MPQQYAMVARKIQQRLLLGFQTSHPGAEIRAQVLDTNKLDKTI
jgi:hypothetical protein